MNAISTVKKKSIQSSLTALMLATSQLSYRKVPEGANTKFPDC